MYSNIGAYFQVIGVQSKKIIITLNLKNLFSVFIYLWYIVLVPCPCHDHGMAMENSIRQSKIFILDHLHCCNCSFLNSVISQRLVRRTTVVSAIIQLPLRIMKWKMRSRLIKSLVCVILLGKRRETGNLPPYLKVSEAMRECKLRISSKLNTPLKHHTTLICVLTTQTALTNTKR